MRKNLSLFCFLSFFAITAGAQSPAQQAFSLSQEAMEASPANYRAPLDSLRKIQAAADDPLGVNIHSQAMATYQSFAGNYDSALYYYDKAFKPRLEKKQAPKIDSAFVRNSYLRNALTALPVKLAQHQVVMINEAHHVPSHRAFAINLLDELHRQGFRHIAFETLYAKDTALLKQRGYPVHESGFYQKEPLFGELMRQALKKGFTLLAYESEVKCTPSPAKDPRYCNRFRDSIQAQNLARWIQKNPEQKLFVYAGYSHVYENTEDTWIRMAEFFRQFTGINPLTIDQEHMSERTDSSMEDQRYRAVTLMKNIQAPMVAYVEDTIWSYSSKVDITVFHPRYLNKTSALPHYQVKHKRPDFYMLHNQRKPILITKEATRTRFSSELLPANTSMIQAFYQKEEGNRIPADVVELQKDQAEAILYLYPGAYEIVYLNEKGKTIMARPIEIK